MVFVTENFIFVDCLIRHLLMERFLEKIFFITNGLSRWSVCWRKIKKPRRILAQSPCVLPIFHVICHYLRFSIINLISVAWTSLERERGGIQISMQFYVFCLLINTETMLDHPHCMFSDFFSVRNKQEREKIFHMTINLCLRIKPEEWSPSEAHAKLSL